MRENGSLDWTNAMLLVVLQEEKEAATQLLMSEMGLHLKTTATTTADVDLTDEETYLYMKRFQALDADGKGFITINDLRTHFKVGLSTPSAACQCRPTMFSHVQSTELCCRPLRYLKKGFLNHSYYNACLWNAAQLT